MTTSAAPISTMLPDPGIMQTELRARLPHFQRVEWVHDTGSTNADLLVHARTQGGTLARPWLLGTHLQSRGRGRAGRTWQNRPGANLMFSCAFDIFLPARQLPTLAPYIGMISCLALRSQLGSAHRHRLGMKWPNDIMWDHAKLAGILTESSRSGTTGSPDHFLIIIGLGLNLQDARALSVSLDRSIADWSEIAALDPVASCMTAPALVSQLARSWHEALGQASASGFEGFPARYTEVDWLSGRTIDVIHDDRLLQSGVATGIDTAGHLLLRNASGSHAVSAGEISIRLQK